MNATSQAVFLSYASQDAEAAGRICDALRAAGIEVWFDQSELRGGDAWDQSIRRQIKTCSLFLPVISRNTHDRVEGYFRLEWKLAIDRSHLIAADQAFLLPVVIDETRDDDERVPERFREVQWTRLPGGTTPATFVERVRRLLAGDRSQEHTGAASAAVRVPAATTTAKPVSSSWHSRAALLATIVAAVALGFVATNRFVFKRHGAQIGALSESTPKNAPATDADFNPPPHSIAVLPFVNLSGDKEQEYFSDGLTEEILNSLSGINELQVAARTSAFSFKGKDVDIGTIARKLNVGAVLEGSVRRSAHTIRITTQLINAVSGFHLWSKTYDRDAGDVLKLQTEIATSVASALKVTLLGDLATKVELGGTRNPAAFDAYLRGTKLAILSSSAEDNLAAITAYTEAIRLDPHYALAFAGRSIALTYYAGDYAVGPAVRETADKAQADARQALALAPDLALGHLALANVSQYTLNFTQANGEYERALALAPGNARVLRGSSQFAVALGRTEAGVGAARRAVVLDPLSPASHEALGRVLYFARRYAEAASAYASASSLDPDDQSSYAWRGLAYYGLGDLERARASCEAKSDYWVSQQCLAMIYEKLARHADAAAVLAKLQAEQGESAAFQYAAIYAQWGRHAKALEWLEKAWRLRDPGLLFLRTDPLLDPLRREPRFQAIERELKFPT